MRLVLAAVMAVMLAVVTTTDRVACFDGCTDDTQHDGSSGTAPSVCGLCHGWNGPPAIAVSAPTALAVETLTTPTSHVLAAHVTPLDHPPKSA